MPDFVDATRKEITQRLTELKPLVDEFHRLEAAASALAGAIGSAASDGAQAVRGRGPGRSRSGASKPAASTTATAPKAARKKPGRPARRKKVGRSPVTKKAGRPAGASSKAASTATKRAGRPKGSGTRAAQALSLVREQPGITIPELAAKMGIQQNYLYRVLPGLGQEKKVEKKGRGWYGKG